MSTAQDYLQDDLQDAVRDWVEASLRVHALARLVLERPEEWCVDFVAQIDTVTRVIGLGLNTAQTFAVMRPEEVGALVARVEAEAVVAAAECVARARAGVAP